MSSLPLVEIRLKTIQIAQWRKILPEDSFMDITIKSGFKPFAPTWDMLLALKAGEMSEDEYHIRYFDLVLGRIMSNKAYYRQIFLDNQPEKGAIVMGCYCKAGKFCHRYIFVENVMHLIAEPLGLNLRYLGEVT